MKKGIAMLLALLMLLASVPTAVLADAPQHSTEYSLLRAEPCDRCEGGTIRKIGTAYGIWVGIDWPDCPRNPNYNDVVEERGYVTTYQCDNCGAGYNTYGTETRLVCNH